MTGRNSVPVDGALALRADDAAGSSATAPPPRSGAGSDEPSAQASAVVAARALLEVLGGWRSPSQLARWTSPALQHDLERRAPRRPISTRLHLVRVRVSEPAPGVAEVAALTLDVGRQRIRVLALRLEMQQNRWIVTRLQTG